MLSTKPEALRMSQFDLGCKINLHIEIIDLANCKSIQTSFAVVLELFEGENNILA